ncbi:hypothetical protein [Methylopila sp. Yamaguchi]|uniref:hypothetical protein n=1 Tax=Methylopila sp. Yamaguchi TaxID=1437817 RepID=UPI000CB1969D|nr:hypothetical protein [Methylopila sp. Yamaguchi]GBD50233.1 hypothetical protein METY_3446 [Methylopila sp. Yamaguchi]
MTSARLSSAAILAVLAFGPIAAKAQDAPDVWSSGYQMGAHWAAVSTKSGDVLSFSCGEGGGPHVQKGASARVVLAAIKGRAASRRNVEAQFVAEGLTLAFPMTAAESELTLGPGADPRALAKLLGALRTAKTASVAVEGVATSFASKGASEALEGVADCAKTQAKP